MRCLAVAAFVTMLAAGAAAGAANFTAGNNLAFYQNLTDTEVRMRVRGESASVRAVCLSRYPMSPRATLAGHTTNFGSGAPHTAWASPSHSAHGVTCERGGCGGWNLGHTTPHPAAAKPQKRAIVSSSALWCLEWPLGPRPVCPHRAPPFPHTSREGTASIVAWTSGVGRAGRRTPPCMRPRREDEACVLFLAQPSSSQHLPLHHQQLAAIFTAYGKAVMPSQEAKYASTIPAGEPWYDFCVGRVSWTELLF